MSATRAIQAALADSAVAEPTTRPLHDINPPPQRPDPAPQRGKRQRPRVVREPAPPPTGGRFESHSFHGTAGARDYRLYVPSTCPAQPRALLVMLHGCTQTPEQFALGTRMNALAEEHGFLVAYPAQPVSANQSRCWNWFRPQDQRRDGGEPALIAGITREVTARFGIPSGQAMVAGLSAGGAMAAIVGSLYPELFAAIGVHSGLPQGAAHDLASAHQAMAGTARGARAASVPTIVFHGDRDTTVNPANGAAFFHGHGTTESGTAGNLKYTRTTYRHGDAPFGEHWVIHGAGHAWAGGDPQGSHADRRGPDASAQMWRFFEAQLEARAAHSRATVD